MKNPNDWVLSAMLAVVALFAVAHMLPVSVDPVLRLEIARNRSPIAELHQARDIIQRKVVHVDKLDLARDGRFAHSRLGDIGYGQNFFVDIVSTFQVRKAGSYRFVVASDDGFSLHVDGRQICAFTRDRALTTQTCTVLLDPGKRAFRLAYFQAGGPAGLKVQYGRHGDGTLYWFGQESEHFAFPH